MFVNSFSNIFFADLSSYFFVIIVWSSEWGRWKEVDSRGQRADILFGFHPQHLSYGTTGNKLLDSQIIQKTNLLRPCFMDLCSVLRVRTGRLKENELVHRIHPPFIARFHVSAYQFLLSFGYAFGKFYRCKCVLINTHVFRLQVSDPCSFQHREELALL